MTAQAVLDDLASDVVRWSLVAAAADDDEYGYYYGQAVGVLRALLRVRGVGGAEASVALAWLSRATDEYRIDALRKKWGYA